MKLSLDHTSDYSHRELYNLLHDIDLPAFVKEAEIEEDQAVLQALDKTAFADTYTRSYPINTPCRVYLSNAYFADKKAELEKLWSPSYAKTIEDNIKRAAEIFGITKEIASYNNQSLEKKAKDYTQDYIFEVAVDGENIVQLYQVKTARDLISAAESFATNTHNFPFDWRTSIAEGFVKKAKELGVDELPDLVCKYAGMFYPDLAKLKEKIWYRSTKLADDATTEAYLEVLTKMAEEAKTKEDVFNIARAAHQVEQSQGLYNIPKIAALLGDPVDNMFTLPIDKVAEMLNVVDMGGQTYHVSELKKIAASIYKEAFGCDIDPQDENQLRDVLPTLPRSDVALFKELSGINHI